MAPTHVPRWRRPAAGHRAGVARAVLAALLGLLAVAQADAATPSPSAPSPSATAHTVFTVGTTEDVDSLNPFAGLSALAYEVRQLTYDFLTDYSATDFSTTPSLAETWTTSPDGRTWTFTLREGATWSDGVPLTSADVAYTIQRVRQGRLEKTLYGGYVANIARVDTPDARTVVITARRPTPVLLHLAIPILPEHVWRRVAESDVTTFGATFGATFGTATVGSGPFLVTEQRRGRSITLERNPHYWGDPPAVDEIVFRVYPDEDALATALRDGDVDFASGLGASAYGALARVKGITAVSAQHSEVRGIAINTGAALRDGTRIGDGDPALADPQLRSAITRAVDTTALVKRVVGGYGSPGGGVVPPVYANWHYDPGDPADTFDPAAAERQLATAGYLLGPDGIRRTPTGRPLLLRLYFRSGTPESRRAVQLVAGWLADVGIGTRVSGVSEDRLAVLIGRGEFDLAEQAWLVEPDPDRLLSTFTCASRSTLEGGVVRPGLSDTFFCDRDYDALYVRQAQQVEPSQRARTVKAMQEMLYEAAPYVVMYYPDDLEAFRSDRFTDFVPQPQDDGSLLFQYGTWSYQSIHPVVAGSTGGSISTTAASPARWLLLTAALVLAVAAGTVVLVRRGRSPLTRRR